MKKIPSFIFTSLVIVGALALAIAAAHGQGVVSDLTVQRTVVFAGDVTPSQITSNQNDYSPTNLSKAVVLRLSTDASRNVTGLTGGARGRNLILQNVGTHDLVLKDQDSGSTAANRFLFGADYTLAAGGGCVILYDATSSRWRMIASRAGTAGMGDVVGPASAVDNRIAVYDSTSGKLLKDGSKTIADINPVGAQTIWIPAGAMVPATTNGPTVSQVELTAGHPEVAGLAFDASTEKSAQFSVAMPKSWNNSTVTAQFYWEHPSTTTNFAVKWSISAVAVSDGDAIDTAFGTAQTVTDTGGSTDSLYVSGATSALTIGGSPATGDNVFFRVARVAADGADTLSVDARLLGVKLTYTISAPTDL